MPLKLKNQLQLQKQLIAAGQRIQEALIYRLEALIAELQNHAKLNAGYQDQTSNLKSSIGGVLLKDGQPVSYATFVKEGTADTGDAIGEEFLNEMVKKVGSGFVILMVAGMEYATYVENQHGLNVLKATELKMQTDLVKIIKKLKTQVDSMNLESLYVIK